MKSVGLILRSAVLLLCAALLCFAVSCMQTPVQTTASTTTAPKTTAPPVGDDVTDACEMLTQLLESASPGSVRTEIRYESPSVGEPLTAETELTLGDGAWTFAYSYDCLAPIGSGSFKTRKSGEISGTASEIGDALSELYLFGVGASDALLLEIVLTAESFSSAELADGCFTAAIKNDSVTAVFGGDLGHATDVSISVAFSETAISAITISYRLGDADVCAVMSLS